MWDNQLFRQQRVDLQFEENDKVEMRLKSTEKKNNNISQTWSGSASRVMSYPILLFFT